MLKNVEGFKAMFEGVTMQGKGRRSRRNPWKTMVQPFCLELLRAAEQILHQAGETNAAETQLTNLGK